MMTESKLCDGCGKDLSNDSAYPSGFDTPYGRNCVQLWRCAPCKIAKDTHRISVFEDAAKQGLSYLGEALSGSPEDAREPIIRTERELRRALTNDSYPSLGRKKDEVGV